MYIKQQLNKKKKNINYLGDFFSTMKYNIRLASSDETNTTTFCLFFLIVIHMLVLCLL